MNILLIGATGFIGQHVVRKLVDQGHRITVYSRGLSSRALPESVRHIIGDRNQLTSHIQEFRHAAPEVVVDFIVSNGCQAREAMDTFRGIAKRMVLLSSGDVYRACGIFHGTEPGPLQPLPLAEESELRTVSKFYPSELGRRMKAIFPWLDADYDKIPAERTVLSDQHLPGTVLRLPMVYGPGDPLHRLFPYLKRMGDHRPAILIQEDLAQWCGPRGYVENVAKAVALATIAENAAGQIYNIAEPEAFSEMEWAERIGRVAGWSGRVIPIAKELTPPHLRVSHNYAQHWIYSTNKIREHLGFAEQIDSDTGLERTIAWERGNRPREIESAQLDYDAEDRALDELFKRTLRKS